MGYRPKPIEFDPTNPYASDALDRRPMVDFIAKVLDREDGALVVSIDSPWGTGKTTFLKMLGAALTERGDRVIELNAWKDDHLSDPLVALLSQLDVVAKANLPSATYANLAPKINKAAGILLRRGSFAAVKLATLGLIDVDKEAEAAISEMSAGAADDLIQAYRAERDVLDALTAQLNELVNLLRAERDTTRVVVFIDELDRCRPDYAIRMLERVKHVFDAVKVVFVLAVDRKQLESSVATVYGQGIDSREYLRRFIDLDFRLPQADAKDFLRAQLPRLGLDDWFGRRSHRETREDGEIAIEVLAALANQLSFSLRVQLRCLMMLRLVADQTPDSDRLHAALTSLLIVLRVGRPDAYQDAVSGHIGLVELVGALGLGANKFEPNRATKVALASFFWGDRNEERRALARVQLSNSDEPWLKSLVDLLDPSRHGFDFPSIRHLARKIDLANNLRGED